MIVIDLCSGLGGATRPFLDRGHKVFTVDNEIDFGPDLCADVRHILPESLPANPYFIWASPPCAGFSVAAIGRHWKNGQPDEIARSGMEILGGCLRIIHALKPKYWCIENPRGMMRRVLGPPTVTTFYAAWGTPYLKPTDLWGILPRMTWPEPLVWESAPRGSKQAVQRVISKGAGCGKGGKDMRPSSSALRAVVPYGLGLALCEAIEKELPFGFETNEAP